MTVGSKKLDVSKMHAATAELILSGLREWYFCIPGFDVADFAAGQLTRVSDFKMTYARYDQDIRAAEGVMVEGWPEDVPFSAPSKIKVSYQVKALYEAWKTGVAHWRVMTAVEKKAIKVELADREPTVRAKRSDAGGSHKRRKVQSDDEDEEEDEEADYRPKKTRTSNASSTKKRGVAVNAEVEQGPAKKRSKRSTKKSDEPEDSGVSKKKGPTKRKAPRDNDNIERCPKKMAAGSKSAENAAPYVFGPAGKAKPRDIKKSLEAKSTVQKKGIAAATAAAELLRSLREGGDE